MCIEFRGRLRSASNLRAPRAAQFRANGSLRNQDLFVGAFSVEPMNDARPPGGLRSGKPGVQRLARTRPGSRPPADR